MSKLKPIDTTICESLRSARKHHRSEPIDITICQRLKLARKHRGFRSARAFALKQRIPVNTYLNHEGGKRRVNITILKDYAKILDIHFTWLATGEGDSGLETAEIESKRKIPISLNQRAQEAWQGF